MRKLLLAFTLLATPAAAQTFTDQYGLTVTCTGSGPVTCTRSDGLQVGAGSAAQASGTFNGMAPSGWTPPAPPAPTTVSALAFINRFSPAEQKTLVTVNPLWAIQIAAAGTITVTDPTLIAQMQQAVAAGALTQARMTQVLNLSVPSP